MPAGTDAVAALQIVAESAEEEEEEEEDLEEEEEEEATTPPGRAGDDDPSVTSFLFTGGLTFFCSCSFNRSTLARIVSPRPGTAASSAAYAISTVSFLPDVVKLRTERTNELI